MNISPACSVFAHSHMSLTPSQHLRQALERAPSYDAAVAALQTTPLIDECYYILAGSSPGEGAVVARFCSLFDAQRKTGVTSANIQRVAGSAKFQAGGFRWRYVGAQPAAETLASYLTRVVAAIGALVGALERGALTPSQVEVL